MQPDHAPTVGQVASAIDGMVSFSVSMLGVCGAELLAWLPVSVAARFMPVGSFFIEWNFGGEARWVRFEYRGVVFSQAVFAAVEVLAERDPALLPSGALWLLAAPRHESPSSMAAMCAPERTRGNGNAPARVPAAAGGRR